MNVSAVLTTCANPRGADCSIYVIFNPKSSPAPNAFSMDVSPPLIIIPASSIPASFA